MSNADLFCSVLAIWPPRHSRISMIVSTKSADDVIRHQSPPCEGLFAWPADVIGRQGHKPRQRVGPLYVSELIASRDRTVAM